MKTLLVSLVFASSILVGCAGGSNNSNEADVDFRPLEKPANAASREYAESLFVKLDDARKYIPAQEAIFNKVLVSLGAESETVEADNKIRQNSLAALNNEGLRLLKEIKAKCEIKNATTVRDSGQPVLGVPHKNEGNMSLTGADCPYKITAQGKVETTVTRSEKTVTSRVSAATLVFKSKKIASLESARVVSLSGVKSFYSETSGIAEIQSMTSDEYKMSTLSSRVSAGGKVEYTLANGEKFIGDIKLYAKTNGDKIQSQMLFEASTSQGVIRVVVKSDGKKTEMFLNGTKYDGPFLQVGEAK